MPNPADVPRSKSDLRFGATEEAEVATFPSESKDGTDGPATYPSSDNVRKTEEPSQSRDDRQSHVTHSQSGKSKKSTQSRKSNFLKRAGTLQKVATFANNLGMDEDELRSDDGKMGKQQSENDDNETGTERLQRALTVETKHKGLFRYTNTLGQTDGMEPDMLARVALEDEWQMVSCASLPFTIIFFVIFMLFFQQHYGITDIFLAEYPFRRVLGEMAWDINEVDGIYEWLAGAYFPYMWATQPRTSTQDLLSTSNMYSTLIGGVQLTTTRATVQPCEDELATHIRCFTSEVSSVDSDNAFFERRLLEDRIAKPDAPAQGEKAVDGSNARALHHERGKAAKKKQNVGPRRRWPVNLALPARGKNTSLERWAAFQRAEAYERRLGYGEHRQRQHRWRVHRSFRGDRMRFEEIDHIKRPRHETFWTSVARRLKRYRPDLEAETPALGVGNLSSIVVSAVDTLQDVIDEVQYWQERKLLRENTLTFQAEALVENNNLGHDLLTHVQFDFVIHGSGSMFSETKVVTLISSAVAEDMLQACMGIAFFVCLSAFSYMLPNRAYMRWRQGRLRSHFFRFWNLVEWMIIMWGWGVVLVFVHERNLIWSLKDSIEEYRKDTTGVHPDMIGRINQRRVPALLEDARAIAAHSQWVQLMVSLYHIILVFRFFLASRGQPRLAIVLSTIRKASVDLFHLFLVFIIIFVAYAVSGHMLFGRRLKEFSTFTAAFARSFQIVMEREYPWLELTEEDQWTATIWVWSFMVLVVMIMVNIFLAMIFDTYGDVRSSVGHSATLWQTSKIVMAHLKHLVAFGEDTQHRWVPNRELVRMVKEMNCHHVTPWMVKDALPGIDNKQVNYLFNLAKNRLENMLVRGNKSSLPAVVASILLGVERMHNELHTITGVWSDDGTIRGTMVSVAPGKKSEALLSDCTSSPRASEKSVKGSRDASVREANDKLSRESGAKFADAPKVLFEENENVDNTATPGEAPHWLTVQLMPHFKKQKMLLTEVHVQIQRIDRAMYLRGIKDLPRNPERTPRQLKTQGALGSPGRGLLPYGPSNATSFGGITPPAALRQSINMGPPGNGSSYDLASSFALPDPPLISPHIIEDLPTNGTMSSRADRSNCCSCKPVQPLHEG